MIKIPTMFERDESMKGHPVKDAVKPECQWVLDGEGIATIKLDGTNVRIRNGALEKRQKPKDRDYDEASYVPCDRANPADRWAYQAFDAGHEGDGIYELVGPKVQGNPQQYPSHGLIPVVPFGFALRLLVDVDRTFDGLRAFLAANRHEGVVFHHPDGRMAKIKRRDYGIPWP